MGKEKYIAVMGVTGVGKSSFIKLVTGDDSIKVGKSLVSETQELGTYKFRHKDRTIVLVDTPGFDDTTQKDADILKLLADWLDSIYRAGVKLSGIIYLHRISDDRMRGSSMRSMRMFRKLCGEAFYRNLLLGTTCWPLVSDEIGVQREKELMTDQNFWKGLIAKGAQFVRIPDDGWDAKELVYDLARMEPASLQIQEEMVDQHINFNDLSAARTLNDGPKALHEAHEKEKQRLQEEHQRQVAEQNRKLEQQRLQLEQEKQVKLRMFQLETEHSIMAESVSKFQDGIANNTYLAKLHPFTNSLGITCDGCCKWIGNGPYYTCPACHKGTFRLCSDCYHSKAIFCHYPSHRSSMEMTISEDGPPECRHIKFRMSLEAVLPCYRCSKNIMGVFSHCCLCLDDNFNMCLQCLTDLGTCKKSWSLSGHRLHAILRRQRHQTPLDQQPPVQSIPEVVDNCLQAGYSTPQNKNRLNISSAYVNVYPATNMQDAKLSHTLFGHSKALHVVKFSPSNNVLVSGGDDANIRLWNPDTGSCLHTLTGHKAHYNIEDLAFAPDGNILASASSDETVQLWDMRTNASVQTFIQGATVFGVAISPDGTKVAAGLSNNKIQIWDSRSLGILHTLKEHKSMVRSVAFSPNGKRMASTGNDKTVRVWDPQAGEILHTIKAHPGMMNYGMVVAFSPDGKTIASGALDSSVKLWKTETGESVRTLKSKTSSHVRDLAFSLDGKTIAVGQLSGQVEFWNAEEGFIIHSLKAHEKTVEAVAFSSDGKLFATGSEDKTIRIWSL